VTLQVDVAWIVATLLVSVRIAAATAWAPVFGPANIPAPVKVFIAISLSALMVTVVAVPSVAIDSIAQLSIAALREAIIGLAFGFGLLAAYAATQIAGRVLDIQVGFGAASVLNPATQTPSPLIGSLFGMTMIAVFLALDGHHLLFRAVASSLVTMPPGSTSLFDASLILKQSSIMFVFGLTLAAPIMFALWLTDLAMAVFARSMPQLNVFVLSFSVKILMGLVGLALSIGVTKMLFNGLFEETFRYWEQLAGPD
jgi:flagellar biosynthetic protein FliR